MISLRNLRSPPLRRTFTYLSKAQAAGLVRGRETITEVLLQDIDNAHPDEVMTFPFNKREERFTGADWRMVADRRLSTVRRYFGTGDRVLEETISIPCRRSVPLLSATSARICQVSGKDV